MHETRHHPKTIVFLWASVMTLLAVIGFGALLLSTDTVSAQVDFATNTPPAPDPLVNMPDAPITQYALRLWTERDLVEVLISQLNRLSSGETTQQMAIPLTLYELEQGFPGAPHHEDQRDRVLAAMLNAPRGTVDMRSVIRPYLVEVLNANLANIRTDVETTVTVQDTSLRIIPVNFDGADPIDAVLHIRYPADAASDMELRYEDFLPVVRNTEMGFSLPELALDLPAAPYNNIEHVRLVRLEDLNNDSLEEMALGVDTGAINNELLIVGWRNQQMINLVAPGEPLLYAEPPTWSFTDGSLTPRVYREESAVWNCISYRDETWQWLSNFYRPPIAPIVQFRNFDTLGCTIYDEEPIFSQDVAEAIVLFHNLVDGVAPDEPGYDRGKMALAVLYYLAGQDASAEAQIASMTSLAQGNAWLRGQMDAFTMATASGVYNPLVLCEALIIQNENGACDLNQVLARILEENPIRRDSNVVNQLRELGLPVLESVTVSEVGRADREVVSFDLVGTGWWAFAPLQPTVYVPELTDPPSGFGAAVFPAGLIEPTDLLYDAIVVDGDPVTVLTTLDNQMRQNPGVPLSSSAQYLRAISSALLADRQNAREAFYELWVDYPNSTWGQLAGAHLERR